MSINALLLDGWDETSTWGVDNGTFYALLTRNGVSDVDGPQIWIAPPLHVIQDAPALARAIAATTGASADVVQRAMNSGLATSRGETHG